MYTKAMRIRLLEVLGFLVCAVFLYYISTFEYLVFHSFAEIISVGMSLAIFIIMYNAVGIVSNNYLRIIGLVYLFIGILDILHTLAYEGMNLFTSGHFYANQLWIATRFFEAVVMLCGFYFVNKKVQKIVDKKFLIMVYSLTTAVILGTIFYWDVFPEAYIAGVGQTKFKIYSEYVISSIFVANLFLLIKTKEYFSEKVYDYLRISFIFYIATELAFTVYVSNFGFANLIGHYFKLLAFYFSYRALVETSIKEPYNTIFRELNEKNEYLEELNKTKDRLFSIIGHDLRSPLAGIKSSLDLVSMEAEENNYVMIKEYIDLMQKSASLTMDLLDNLLNWSRSQNNSLSVNKELISISRLIDGNLAFFSNISRQKNIIILYNRKNSGKLVGYADKTMITTVVRNILNNALKFTPGGGKIEVNARLDGEFIEISVSDNGVGIKDEDKPKLFNFSTNISTYGTGGEKGTGLGLVLCKDFVERNGGRIWVESIYGKGTTFYFTIMNGNSQISSIPVEYQVYTATEQVAASLVGNEVVSHKPKLLLAEDDVISRQIIIKMMEKKGLACDVADDGDKALKIYYEQNYDIILMDCVMPCKDGYEVTSRIREYEGDRKHTTIIAMTASTAEGDRERCLKAGMDYYISKPVDFEVLFDIISNCTSKYR